MRDKLRASERAGEMDRGWRVSGRVSRAFGPSLALWVSASRLHLCLPHAFHPRLVSLAHFLSRVFITLCGSLHAGLSRCHCLFPFHHYLPVNLWDAPLPSKAASEAGVLHIGWNRPKASRSQSWARRPAASLVSDLLFEGPSLTRPGLRLGPTGYALCWIHLVTTMYVGDKLGVAGAGLVLRSGAFEGPE